MVMCPHQQLRAVLRSLPAIALAGLGTGSPATQAEPHARDANTG